MTRRLAHLFVLFVACTPRPSAPAPEVETHEVVAPPPAAAARRPDPRMADHFRDAVAIKDAVIAGELVDARAPAQRLTDDRDPHPASWRPFVAANAAHANALLGTRDRHVAAAAAAGLARTCGDCHAALGVGPRFDPPHDIPTPSSHDPRQHMQRHQWAADRMWEALIDRSEYAWMAGAAALKVPPLGRAELTRDVELADDVLELNAKVHELGALASTTIGWDARATLYGDFLATCAGCHQGGC
jgi:cytochrome c553